MLDKIRKVLYETSEVLEVFMAIVVVAGIIVATISLWPEFLHYWDNRMQEGAFLELLDAVFNVVIGLEFVRMLCKPNSANIIEVLIFLISRHMILQKTSAVEDLLAVISIGILFIFRRFMLATKPDKKKQVPSLLRALKAAQSPEFQAALDKIEKENQEAEQEQSDKTTSL